jgi:indole-3-glycerol phosphate synthase
VEYDKAGAQAVSVLTDEKFFQGSLKYLRQIRNAVRIPVLRKDFIIDTIQVEQAVDADADAVLLIAAALSDSQMEELNSACLQLDIESLIEIHELKELERVMRLSPSIIGINNRDLETFKVDIATTHRILPYVPKDSLVVSESGIFTGEDTTALMDAGVHAVLVGESLMRASNTADLIRELQHKA